MIPGIRDDEHPGIVLVLFAVGAVVIAALLTIIGRAVGGDDAPRHRDDLAGGRADPKPKAQPKDNDKAARIARLRAATQAKRDAAKAKAGGGTPPPAAAGGAA